MTNSVNFKGITYSVIAIIALVGIIGTLVGMSYQSAVGSGVSDTMVEKSSQDKSVQQLENTKATLAQDLRFGSMGSTLDVAAQGATADPVTYWYCNNQPQPPEMNEVLFAVSNRSTAYLNAYIETLKEELKEKYTNVSNCECCTVTPPEKEICMNEDCESYGTGAKNEEINVTFPAKTKYVGDLEVDVSPVRFWMFYYRLYDYFSENNPLSVIIQSMRGSCPEPENVKYEIAYKDLCQEMIKELSRHDDPGGNINCTTISSGELLGVSCTHKFVDCKILETGAPHQDCEREPKEDLCFIPATKGITGNFAEDMSEYENGISIATGEASLAGDKKGILIELKDKKFKPLGSNPMIFNINAVFVLDDLPECTPIDK